jgi:hypothetical protein
MSAGAGPGQYGPPSRAGRPGLLVAVVIVAMLAVGGGVFAVVWSLTGRPSAASAAGQGTSPASPSVAATTTAAASPTASAAPGTSTVGISPAAAANPAAAQVQALTNRYFAAINAHDYPAYSSLLDPRMRQQNPQSTFSSGYATTQDSAETLTAISAAGTGKLAATVSFTSHQSPAKSANDSTCTKWLITLYLLPDGNSYLITAAPPGYRASYQSC